ncbi:MAG: TfoX/Sxy family protein [Thaumarchaeota archaeon]|nr:TfoX/Sxy family protein [Nitrososphaerota archaeon]
MKIPHPTKESSALFKSMVPKDPRVTTRPMFGNVSAFVNGNMFMGVYGDDLFVRLSGEDRDELLGEAGASVFEPMKGKQMKEYILVPRVWRTQPKIVTSWVSRSMDWASKLPKKGGKKK